MPNTTVLKHRLECADGADEAVVAVNTQASLRLHIQEPALAAAAGAGEVRETATREDHRFLVQGLRAS
jgi:hypothetical protein